MARQRETVGAAKLIHRISDRFQVRWIYAWRVTAKMVEHEPRWDRTHKHLVEHGVRAAGALLMPDRRVTRRELPALPFPAARVRNYVLVFMESTPGEVGACSPPGGSHYFRSGQADFKPFPPNALIDSPVTGHFQNPE